MPRPFIIILFIFAFAEFACAAKTDIILMQNGDRITGEIKKLEFGKLAFKTDDMGALAIEWEKVMEVTAKAQNFEIEVQSGDYYFGTLHPSRYRYRVQIRQKTGSGASPAYKIPWFGKQQPPREQKKEPIDIFLWQIVRITPIKDSQLARVNADVSLGFDYTKASHVKKFLFEGSANYTSQRYRLSVSASSNTTHQENRDPSKRQELNLNGHRYMNKRLFTEAVVSFQQNTELGVNFRVLVGGGVGRDLWVTNYHILQTSGGILLNKEDTNDKEHPESSTGEAALLANYRLFLYDTPKTDLNVSMKAFPNISQWGRLRGEFETKVVQEIIKDLTFNIKLYYSFDTQPLSEIASKSDWGVNLTFGYKL